MIAAAIGALTFWLIGLGASSSAAAASANWSLAQMRAPEAWKVATGRGVSIGLVDSGIDPTAQDVQGRVVATADCVGSGGSASSCRPGSAPDLVGHGTVVGSVAAQVAPGATFVAARAVASKVGYDDDVAAAVEWVVDHGAQIVNVSIAGEDAGGVFLSPRMEGAVELAWTRGVIPVLAAGNMGGASPYGNLDAVVAGATASDGTLAGYSERTTTAKWGVAAPGGVVMTVPGGTQVIHSGTSIAAPNAAGGLALLLQQGASRDVAIQRLLSTAQPCAGCGHGRIDLAAALGIPRVVAPPTTRRAPVPVPAPTTTVAPPDPIVPDPSLLDRAPSLDS